MALEEYKNVRQPLPTVADFRADEGELAKPPEEKTAPTMEELMAQLAQKYGRHCSATRFLRNSDRIIEKK